METVVLAAVEVDDRGVAVVDDEPSSRLLTVTDHR